MSRAPWHGRPVLDHLVVAAPSLDTGVPWLSDRLGVAPTARGRHERFGTHNALWALDGGAYLELIAADPDAPPLGRARWFALDTDVVRRRLEERPRLLHWVARVGAVRPAWQSDHGEPRRLARDTLTWTITVPADGSLPGDGSGVWPSLIVWDGAHPSDGLDDVGLHLERLVLSTPHPDPLRTRLTELAPVGDLGTRVVVAPGPAGLRAELRTPAGPVLLS